MLLIPGSHVTQANRIRLKSYNSIITFSFSFPGCELLWTECLCALKIHYVEILTPNAMAFGGGILRR